MNSNHAVSIFALICSVGWLGCTALSSDGDGAANDEVVEQYVVIEGGFGGPATRGDWEAATESPHVQCGLADVAHDDIDDTSQTQVPDDGWSRQQADSGDRCGDDYETLLFRLSNCERRARDLPPLKCDLRATWISREHSKDMRDRGYFSHRSPEGKGPGERLADRGVEWSTSAENIALAPTMAHAHEGWMESEGHRQNILRREVTHMGIGVIETEYGYMMTQMFTAGFD